LSRGARKIFLAGRLGPPLLGSVMPLRGSQGRGIKARFEKLSSPAWGEAGEIFLVGRLGPPLLGRQVLSFCSRRACSAGFVSCC